MSTIWSSGIRRAESSESCAGHDWLSRLTLSAAMAIRPGISDPGNKAERTDPTGEGHPEPLNGLLNTVARFEVARLNHDQPVYNRVAMEYVDNNAYEIKANPEAADYDMWDCCFIQLFSYGKHNQQHPNRLSARIQLKKEYEYLVNRVRRHTRLDLSALPPRAWPDLSILNIEQRSVLLDLHCSAPPLRFISDIDVKLVQRLLHYSSHDLWLSEEDKDWHYPLLITIRDKTTRNWRERKPEKLAARKARKQ